MTAMYKVLLVDDEVLDLEGMRAFIPWTDLGMEVSAAVNNGFDAYEVLERERIDILVTDVRMPNMTGLELTKRGLTLQPHLKVIFVSGYQDFQFVKQALSLQACNYVLKPTDDDELIESLEKIRGELEQRRRSADGPREESRNGKWLHELTEYIQEHLHENVTLKDLAEKFSFSPNYLGLLFKEKTDQYFSDYLNTLRMERAKELLLNTNKKVYEVADLTGYRYLPYFSKKFRECYGMSPLEYRKFH